MMQCAITRAATAEHSLRGVVHKSHRQVPQARAVVTLLVHSKTNQEDQTMIKDLFDWMIDQNNPPLEARIEHPFQPHDLRDNLLLKGKDI
jgi:hypothetical protein